jgi:hypothetical protein
VYETITDRNLHYIKLIDMRAAPARPSQPLHTPTHVHGHACDAGRLYKWTYWARFEIHDSNFRLRHGVGGT